jgi:hypothetical protein
MILLCVFVVAEGKINYLLELNTTVAVVKIKASYTV